MEFKWWITPIQNRSAPMEASRYNFIPEAMATCGSKIFWFATFRSVHNDQRRRYHQRSPAHSGACEENTPGFQRGVEQAAWRESLPEVGVVAKNRIVQGTWGVQQGVDHPG